MTLPVHDGLLQIFDVEHGACALLTVTAPNGGVRRLLIDCGHNASTRWTPGGHLKSLGVTQIEQLIITNYDEDHVSGYRSLADHCAGVSNFRGTGQQRKILTTRNDGELRFSFQAGVCRAN